ncbi:DUF1488 family protein [Burkholderia perseverans]|uniref:DUF1488 family protein n=1 Tax=Burkholderia perseverans TaxID=2615214 RepID=UPI001FEE0021|nr:DUF1488 family protein [Burkholderia perseverans]
MTPNSLRLTAPVVTDNDSIRFSAYAPGWGYTAYALSAETLRQRLGAADASPQQLLLAFELGKQRLTRAIEQRISNAPHGERVTLTPDDLR